ncbi:MAG: CheW protein [Candidatus Peregrinibacteria bacterium Greene0416_19]|nr:MAG: CheW protein [Candidatus Peregrinibacteria bacterium Greene0416_19]
MTNAIAKKAIQQVAAQAQRTEEKAVETKQIVTFDLNKEEYAAGIADLREIIKVRDIIPVPGAPEFIAGIVNVRGQIVIVVDLEKRFSLKREGTATHLHIIIAEVEDTVFGILVDEVTGVLRVPVTSIKPAPALVTSKIHADYLNGVVMLEEGEAPKPGSTETDKRAKESAGQGKKSRLILLLDIPRMLSDKELLQFGNVIQETIKEEAVTVKEKAATISDVAIPT